MDRDSEHKADKDNVSVLRHTVLHLEVVLHEKLCRVVRDGEFVRT